MIEDDFIDKIRKDLNKSGFNSELIAKKIIANLGWKFSGGSAYFDKDEEKSREIDIVAHRPNLIKYGDKVVVSNSWFLFVEVKKTEKPWVVFRKKTEKYFDSCSWNNIVSAIDLPCDPYYLTNSLKKYSLLKINGWEGTGIHESFKNPDQNSKWYGAFLTACKAAVSYDEEYGSEGDKLTKNIMKNSTEISFHQPVVVLDGLLFSANLNQENEIIVEEIESAAFNFEYKSKNYKRNQYRVDLVTINGLENYINLVNNRQSSLTKELLKQIKNKSNQSINLTGNSCDLKIY